MDGENNNDANDAVNDDAETDAAEENAAVEDEAETKTRIPHVDNIEHIEHIEITENVVNQFMTYFPHLVVGAISLLVLIGVGFMLVGGKVGQTAEAARGLITFLVVVITIVIALILTLLAFFSNSKDLKERFALGKDILTLLIGVLGTIIGFYFGSAERERKPPEAETAAVVNANKANTNTANTNPAVNANVAVIDKSRQQLVAELEAKGFNAIVAQDFNAAQQAFGQAYKTWDIYHSVDEINRLLQARSEKFNAADAAGKNAAWSEIYCEIESKYELSMAADVRTQFRQTLKTKNYPCGNDTAFKNAN